MATWEDALFEDANSVPDSEVAAEADDARCLSEDDSDSQPSSQSECLEATWWWTSALGAAVMEVEGQELQNYIPQRPLRILSCCTGCSAESETLKARGFLDTPELVQLRHSHHRLPSLQTM